ncbi:MAG TPA: hypothetical protein VGM22_27650 [Methylomirabilota bacterium]
MRIVVGQSRGHHKAVLDGRVIAERREPLGGLELDGHELAVALLEGVAIGLHADHGQDSTTQHCFNPHLVGVTAVCRRTAQVRGKLDAGRT